jgi:hypothetical protein
MEPVTVVLGLAAIIGTGALTKIGENITDKLTQHVKNYREFLKRKAPNSNTVKALEAGGSIDYGQAHQELESVAKDAEAIELVAAIQAELVANPKLKEWIEQELNQKQSQLATIENWQGINIKGGINTITGNTLNF